MPYTDLYQGECNEGWAAAPPIAGRGSMGSRLCGIDQGLIKLGVGRCILLEDPQYSLVEDNEVLTVRFIAPTVGPRSFLNPRPIC